MSAGPLKVPPHVSETARVAAAMFEAGDFAAARALASAVLRRRDEFGDDDLALARDILDRTRPDPVVIYMGLTVLAAVILIFVWAVWVSHH